MRSHIALIYSTHVSKPEPQVGGRGGLLVNVLAFTMLFTPSLLEHSRVRRRGMIGCVVCRRAQKKEKKVDGHA